MGCWYKTLVTSADIGKTEAYSTLGLRDGRRLFRPWEPGKLLLGEFAIERLLGKGGMGAVYLVRRTYDDMLYAVKTLHESQLRHADSERYFLQELLTWMRLQPHENLVRCLFFRTIENRLAIFSEYIEGETLAARIAGKKQRRLEAILDVAIQVARGLHAAHSQGVIHQDVKPANILITREGVAKITDFGLARAIRRGGVTPDASAQDITRQSPPGMTPAYCSPEQAAEGTVDHRTDIWSFGLTVLEMFLGGATWRLGVMARNVLADIQAGAATSVPVPERLLPFFDACFQLDASRRWRDMASVVQFLEEFYAETFHRKYPRPTPALRSAEKKPGEFPRRLVSGENWKPIEAWVQVFSPWLSPHSPAAGLRSAGEYASFEDMLLDDLAKYEELQRWMDNFRGAPDDERLRLFAEFLSEKANIHAASRDYSGALSAYRSAIRCLEQLAKKTRASADRLKLAKMYCNQANVFNVMGDYHRALQAYDAAIAAQAFTPSEEERAPFYTALAITCLNKGNLLWKRMDYPAALECCEKSIALRRRGDADSTEGKLFLATVYINQAAMLKSIYHNEKVVEVCNEAMKLLHSVSAPEKSHAIRKKVAHVHSIRAAALDRLGNSITALEDYQRSIAIWKTLVFREGVGEFSINLAGEYFNLGNLLIRLGRLMEASEALDNAMSIAHDLVYLKGDGSLSYFPAVLRGSMGFNTFKLGDVSLGLKMLGNAITVLERYILTSRQKALHKHLSKMYSSLAGMLKDLGRLEEARNWVEKSLRLYCATGGGTPDNLQYRVNLASAYHELAYLNLKMRRLQPALDAIARVEEALKGLETRVELRSDVAKIALMKAEIRWKSGEKSREIMEEIRCQAQILHDEYLRTRWEDLRVRLKELQASFPNEKLPVLPESDEWPPTSPGPDTSGAE